VTSDVTTFPTAKALLSTYLANIHQPEVIRNLFADDATIELPYLKSLGRRWQWRGRQALDPFLDGVTKAFEGFEFQNIVLHIDTPTQVFAEYEVHCTFLPTGRPYHQLYMGRLVAENGKIILLREAMDLAQVAITSLPNGVQDLGGH
jgi:ketosteroid isomerase-like protein